MTTETYAFKYVVFQLSGVHFENEFINEYVYLNGKNCLASHLRATYICCVLQLLIAASTMTNNLLLITDKTVNMYTMDLKCVVTKVLKKHLGKLKASRLKVTDIAPILNLGFLRQPLLKMHCTLM